MFALASSLRNKAAALMLCIGGLAAAVSAAGSSAPARHRCETQHDAAHVAISTEIDHHGDRQKLRSQLDSAWRAFWKHNKLDIANAQLDAMSQRLSSTATMGSSTESKVDVRDLVDEFRQCINGQVAVGTATLAVSLFNYDETLPGGKGPAAGAGVYVFVDGKPLASTDGDGKALVTVPAGTVSVQAIVPSTALAEATVQANAGTIIPLELILDDSKEVTSPVELSVSSLSRSVLPSGFASFTITLLDGGVPRAAAAVAEVAVEDDLGNTLVRLTDEFAVDAEGRLLPIAVAPVVNAVRAHVGRRLVLRVMAEDALGFTLVGTVPFSLGQLRF